MNTNQQVESSMLASYKGIITLNNIGVTLLERACYRQAMTVFKSAIHSMKSIFGEAYVDGYESSLLATEQQLRTANKYLASSVQPCGHSYSQQVMGVEICFQDMNYSEVKSLLHKATLASVGVPIRIGDVLCDGVCIAQDTDLETAILMYNMGLSYQFVANEASKGNSSFDMLSGCRKLLRFAASILFSRSQVCENEIELLGVLFATSLVLANLSCVEESPPDWIEYDCAGSKEAHANLLKVREVTYKMIEELPGMLGVSLLKQTAAAA